MTVPPFLISVDFYNGFTLIREESDQTDMYFKTRNRKKMSAVAAVILTLSLILSFMLSFALRASCAVPDTSAAEAVYLYCIDNGILMYESNSEKSVSPYAMVKMMVGLIACERLSEKLDTKITITSQMIAGAGQDKQMKMKVVEGEVVPLRDLLYGLLCCGYNDCATALAIYISGSVKDFVSLMNLRASELGMNSTQYQNVIGTESGSARTTAADTAKLALQAAKNELYVEISSTAKYVLSATNKSSEIPIYNRNYLISEYPGKEYHRNRGYYNSDCRGLCSGDSGTSRHSVATLAKKDDTSYLCIVLNAALTDTKIYSFSMVTELLNWTFRQFSYKEVVKEGESVCKLPVHMSDVIKETDICAEKSISLFIPSGDSDNIKTSYRLNYSSLKAPIEKGTAVGYLTVTYNSQTVTVRLVTSENIEGSKFLYTMNSITEISQSRVFKASIVCMIILSAIAIFIDYRIRKKAHDQIYLRHKIDDR